MFNSNGSRDASVIRVEQYHVEGTTQFAYSLDSVHYFVSRESLCFHREWKSREAHYGLCSH